MESSINSNSTNISSNDTDIASNASDITTNASNISSNDTDIASNTTSITTINDTTLARFSSGARVYSNTSDENTALGDVSLNTIIAGGQSGKHNVAIGAGTMYNLTREATTQHLDKMLYTAVQGSYNVALEDMRYDNVTGDRNTALGYRAGFNGEGDGNVLLVTKQVSQKLVPINFTSAHTMLLTAQREILLWRIFQQEI